MLHLLCIYFIIIIFIISAETYPHEQRAPLPVEPDSEVLRLGSQLRQYGVQEGRVRTQTGRQARVVA